MAVQILEWAFQVGKPLPQPVLKDDSDSYPPELVKLVREQLMSDAVLHKEKKDKAAVPQTFRYDLLGLNPGPKIEWQGKPWEKLEMVEFQHGKLEIAFKDRKGVVLAKYFYLAARAYDGKVILGPQLYTEKLAQIS